MREEGNLDKLTSLIPSNFFFLDTYFGLLFILKRRRKTAFDPMKLKQQENQELPSESNLSTAHINFPSPTDSIQGLAPHSLELPICLVPAELPQDFLHIHSRAYSVHVPCVRVYKYFLYIISYPRRR